VAQAIAIYLGALKPPQDDVSQGTIEELRAMFPKGISAADVKR
jgi:hypothetical protein